jgi:hypothetical protein
VPVKARPAVLLAEQNQVIQKRPADPFAAGTGVDEQVFEIAVLAANPCAFMRQ